MFLYRATCHRFVAEFCTMEHLVSFLRGAHSGNARLTDDQVREIRTAYASGETQVSIARRMGLYQGHVSAVVLRRSWSHVA